MATITASEVNNLRKITGAGMMDCKNALVESNGDVEMAIDILRKKGQKVANKRADRSASEGAIIARVNANASFGAVVMLNCETDFVGKNTEFVEFANDLAVIAVDGKISTTEQLLGAPYKNITVKDKLDEMVGKIGEKIEIGQLETIDAALVVAYIHPGNRLASLVGLNVSGDVAANAGKDVAMQVAAMSPVALNREDVSPEVIAREKEIAMELARNEGKPEEMIEKIATGRVNKFLTESTLMNQEFIKDNKKTVQQYLESTQKGMTATAFRRLALA